MLGLSGEGCGIGAGRSAIHRRAPGMVRVVLDTNVLVSASFEGIPERILYAWTDRRFEILESVEVLTGYRRDWALGVSYSERRVSQWIGRLL